MPRWKAKRLRALLSRGLSREELILRSKILLDCELESVADLSLSERETWKGWEVWNQLYKIRFQILKAL